MEMRDNVSHSSDRSVVIVSDHDGNFEYESDECKTVQSGKENVFLLYSYFQMGILLYDLFIIYILFLGICRKSDIT